MSTITIHCTGCKNTFPFQHPAAPSSKRLATATLTCPHCKQPLVQADRELIMEPIHTRMGRRAEAEVPEPKLHIVEPKTSKTGELSDTEKAQIDRYIAGTKRSRPTNLPQSPLADHDELAALRDRLNNEGA